MAICKLLLKVLAADGDSSGLEAERSRAWVQELKVRPTLLLEL